MKALYVLFKSALDCAEKKKDGGYFWDLLLTWTTLYKNENTSDTQAFFLEVATTDKGRSGTYIQNYHLKKFNECVFKSI